MARAPFTPELPAGGGGGGGAGDTLSRVSCIIFQNLETTKLRGDERKYRKLSRKESSCSDSLT